MATEITMPKLSDTMTEGRLIAWKKAVGDRVERGDIIAEVETDKANMELEAFSSGVLLETRVKLGEMVPVGTVIAIIGTADERGVEAQAEEPPAANLQPPVEAAVVGDQPERIMATPEETVPVPVPGPGTVGAGDKASPMVRRLARERGVDLAQVAGSGPEGRILQEDLERYLQSRTAAGEEPAGAAASQPLTRMRAAIARTVSEAWRSIPHFTLTVVIGMGEAENVHRELKGAGTPISINDMIIKAAAMALPGFPLVNASLTADGVEYHEQVNIGFAVSLDDGLLVPVISGCQGLSLKDIAARSRELVERARSGAISEAEISGGTFSVSNLGMFGVEEFSAIILPPQGAILAVGEVRDEAVIRAGQVAAARVMRATLSADHRLIDGAYAARFMAELKRVLENPVVMLV